MFIDARVTPARESRTAPPRLKGRTPPKRLSRIGLVLKPGLPAPANRENYVLIAPTASEGGLRS